MILLTNEYLQVSINPKGAEMVSVKDIKSNHEFMWQGNYRYWNRTAPVLFPIVGSLIDDRYQYEGKPYHLTQHGFARDMVFETQTVTDNSATFFLKSNADTLQVYPFEFSFQITYILFEDKVSISYEVLNPDAEKDLFYSVGGHPGFAVCHHRPMKGQPEFQGVSFSFEPAGAYYQVPIIKGRADLENGKFRKIEDEPILHKSFKRDALVFRLPTGTKVHLKDPNNGVTLTMSMSNFDYLGIWSSYPKKAGFVCLEPWAGITDPIDASGDLVNKHGIVQLQPGKIMTHDYTIQFQKQ